MCAQPDDTYESLRHSVLSSDFGSIGSALGAEIASELHAEAIRRGDYETAVRAALAGELVSIAFMDAQRHEDEFNSDREENEAARLRIFYGFLEADDDKARILQHRWRLSRRLPEELRR